ncbi:MAG: hypothetical protein E6230_28660 [Paenibacillus dendritiformis]|uniref:hypothetical protein n=1 Tax=Paenibacillus dendritiformis TaxID=130049 RepID=UPI00143DD28D|nr:hypothetical protein [Paenibacillus dendritiformis]MDU5146123.1 hypothetical protein [Paenibacillus dendritiformis]NKI23500.1 hypothetical protein [Paenibacillus dendritiformis]NRG01089.1 hypothetical protein [Paenibacillus dendritiformis]
MQRKPYALLAPWIRLASDCGVLRRGMEDIKIGGVENLYPRVQFNVKTHVALDRTGEIE